MKETANISSFALLNNKAFIAVLLISMGTGYGLVINMSVSPYVADFFNLSEQALVSLFAWTSLGAFGTIYLTRWVDILGRRLLTIICYNLSLIFCVLTAFAPSVITYVIAQFFFVALIGVAFATVTVMAGEYLPAEQRAKGMTLQVLVHALGHGGPMLLIVFLANLDNAWQWMWLSLPLTSLPFVLFVLKNLKEPSFWSAS